MQNMAVAYKVECLLLVYVSRLKFEKCTEFLWNKLCGEKTDLKSISNLFSLDENLVIIPSLINLVRLPVFYILWEWGGVFGGKKKLISNVLYIIQALRRDYPLSLVVGICSQLSILCFVN